MCVRVCVCLYVRVCVWVREREPGREKERHLIYIIYYVGRCLHNILHCMKMCVCVYNTYARIYTHIY